MKYIEDDDDNEITLTPEEQFEVEHGCSKEEYEDKRTEQTINESKNCLGCIILCIIIGFIGGVIVFAIDK